MIRTGRGFASAWRRIAAPVSVLAFTALLMGPAAASADAATLHVATVGGSDASNACHEFMAPCATIQHAIDEASAGDTIRVDAGTYAENLTIDKSLTLLGPNANSDPVIDSRDPEAIVGSGSGTAIAPEAENIVIDGFTVSTGDTGSPIFTSGADVNGLTIADNIIGSGVAAIRLEAGGEGISVERNLIEGDGYGIFLGGAGYTDLTIDYNRITRPVNFYGIFNDGSATIDGFELSSNEIEAMNDIGATITNGSVSENVFDVDSPGSVGLQIDLHESLLIDNSFQGHGTAACLQLLGSQNGLDPSQKLTISGSDFDGCVPYGVQLSPDVEAVHIVGNTFTGSYDGVNTRNVAPWDVTGRDIQIFLNRIVGTTHLGVDNSVEGTLDARENWWGCNAGPGAPGCDGASSGVDTSPNIVLTAEALEDPEACEAPVTELSPGGEAVIIARLDTNSAGAYAFGVPTAETTVSFSSPHGSFSQTSTTWQNDRALSIFTAGVQPGLAGIAVTMDNQQVGVPLTIIGPSSPTPSSPTSIPLVSQPRIEIPRGTVNVLGRRPTVGTIRCGGSVCRVGANSAAVKIGGRRYRVQVSCQPKSPLAPPQQSEWCCRKRCSENSRRARPPRSRPPLR